MPEQDLIISFRGEEVNVVKIIDGLMKRLDGLEKGVEDTTKKINKNTRKWAASFKKAGDGLIGMSNRIGKAFTGMTAKITGALGVAGFIGIVTKSIKVAKEFETALAEVGTLIGEDATESVAKFRTEITEFAKASSASAVGLTKGLYQVISAGTKGTEDAAKAMDLLKLAHKASVAGITDVFSSVDLLTTSLNSYNVSADQASEFSDKLFTAVKLGKTTFNELASNMGNVAATAAAAGVSFGEVNAAFATLTKAGVNTAQSSTALKTVIASLLTPSKELTKNIQGMGKGYLTVADALKEEGLLGIMKRINETTGGSAAEITKLIKSQRALTAVSILAGTGIDNFNDSVEAMNESAGATDEAFAKMSDTFDQKLKSFLSGVEDLMISLGTELIPLVTEYMEELGKWVDQNGDEIKAFFKDSIEALVAGLKWIAENGKDAAAVLFSIWGGGKLVAAGKSLSVLAKSLGGVAAALKAIAVAGATVAALGPAIGGALGLGQAGAAQEAGKKQIEDRMNLYKLAVAKATLGMDDLVVAGLTRGTEQYVEVAKKVNVILREQTGVAASPAVTERAIAEFSQQMMMAAEQELDRRVMLEEAAVQKELDNKLAAQAKLVNEQEMAAKKAAAIQADFDKKRKADLEIIRDLRMATATEVKALQMKHAKEREKLASRVWASRKSQEEAMAALRKKHQMESAALAKKIKDRQFKEEEKFQKAFEKLAIGGVINIAEQNRKRRERIESPGMMDRRERAIEEEKAGTPLGKIKGFMEDVTVGFAEQMGASVYDSVTGAFSAAIDPITNLMMVPFEKISGVFGDILGGAGLEDVKSTVQGITSFFEGLAESLPAAIQWFATEGVPMILDAFVENLPIIVESLVQAIPVILDHIIANLEQIILPLVEGVLTLIPLLIERLPALIQALLRMLPKIIAAIIRAIPDIIQAFIQAIPEIIFAFIQEIPNIAWQLAKAIVEMIGGLFKSLSPTGALGIDILPDEIPIIGKLLHSGGMISNSMGGFQSAVADFSHAARAHAGVYIGSGLGDQEVPIIAKVGEAVMNEKFVANAGGKEAIDEMNRTGQMNGGGGVVNNYLSVNHMMSRDTREVIDDMVGQNLNEKVGATNQIVENRYRSAAPGFKPRIK